MLTLSWRGFSDRGELEGLSEAFRVVDLSA